MDIYARVAIPHMWIVDPIPKILESYQLDGGRWLRLASRAGDACVRAVPFDAIELDLGGWWTEPDPARPEPSDPA